MRKDSLGKASTEVQLGEAESKKREQSPSKFSRDNNQLLIIKVY